MTYPDYTILEHSILNLKRFGQNSSFMFDPREHLTINRASINELVADVTISALSLNTWYSSITTHGSQYKNVCGFVHPVNFSAPYAPCLGLTLVFIVLGLNALRPDGVAATDGGFLQIMMTTRVNTVMSRKAREGSLGGRENVPQALKDLKARFGELVGESEAEGEKRNGFGTVGETVGLKRER